MGCDDPVGRGDPMGSDDLTGRSDRMGSADQNSCDDPRRPHRLRRVRPTPRIGFRRAPRGKSV